MEYYSAIKRNEIGSFVETWMDLETVIQSEVSQKPRKMVQMNRFAGQKLRHRCREQRYGHQGGKRGWGELGDWD